LEPTAGDRLKAFLINENPSTRKTLMNNNPIHAVVAALMLVILPAGLAAQQKAESAQASPKKQETIAELELQSAKAKADGNWVRWYAANAKLHSRRPHVPDYMVNIVLAASRVDRRQTAYHYMLKMQQQGLSYDFNQFGETEPLRATEAYNYINDLMKEAGATAGEGHLALSLDVAPSDLGDVAWDESRERFLVGTRGQGQVLAVNDDGESEVILEAGEENGLWSIDGVAVDAGRNTLWITSTATPEFAGFKTEDANRAALFRFELDSLELAAKYELPRDRLPHSLGSMALTTYGDVYVVDRATPIVYLKAADSEVLEPFVGSPELVALTDIAVTPDNSRVFVADAVLGILLIDPRARRMAMLGGPETINLYGIYGLEFSGDELVVTQSGLSPQRIVRLKLDPQGAAVQSLSPMAIALDGFDTPGAGTLRYGTLYYFANHGSMASEGPLKLMATPLDAGTQIKPPDMEQFEKIIRDRMATDPQ
jgi:hypothetical protein